MEPPLACPQVAYFGVAGQGSGGGGVAFAQTGSGCGLGSGNQAALAGQGVGGGPLRGSAGWSSSSASASPSSLPSLPSAPPLQFNAPPFDTILPSAPLRGGNNQAGGSPCVGVAGGRDLLKANSPVGGRGAAGKDKKGKGKSGSSAADAANSNCDNKINDNAGNVNRVGSRRVGSSGGSSPFVLPLRNMFSSLRLSYGFSTPAGQGSAAAVPAGAAGAESQGAHDSGNEKVAGEVCAEKPGRGIASALKGAALKKRRK
mmetsp:Transcript_58115/g.109494  ORF Transcript_58115/g.109494 Transcript_58115/m.109494 type:complete len:258 (-) Transcript_58115:117-890(-)